MEIERERERRVDRRFHHERGKSLKGIQCWQCEEESRR